MEIELLGVDRLRYADGSPVRAASAVVGLGPGFLVVPDDSTRAAWFRDGAATAVRVLPPVEGHDHFDEQSGTKHLKPDLEAALDVGVDGEPAVLLLGSGSSGRRMRWALVRLVDHEPEVVVADMSLLYDAASRALSVRPEDLNLEGACVVGDVLRWYHRGLPSAGLPSGSVDVGLAPALAAVLGRGEAGAVPVGRPRHYDLGTAEGVGLAITDVVALPSGVLLASAAAEDTPNPRDDGPVVASALAVLDGETVLEVVPLPLLDGEAGKVEGLAVLEADEREAVLLAVADVDDPGEASRALRLRVRGVDRLRPARPGA